jgi:hypothetical protein
MEACGKFPDISWPHDNGRLKHGTMFPDMHVRQLPQTPLYDNVCAIFGLQNRLQLRNCPFSFGNLSDAALQYNPSLHRL